MKNISLLMLLSLIVISCGNEEGKVTNDSERAQQEIAKIEEENYDLRNDSVIFNSATIENFDVNGNSIDVYWIGEGRDTVLRFYRTYDENKKLIGAEYYEEGDTEPSRDTVYTNADGQKVEASLNAQNQISWKSTFTTDDRGNPILKTY